MKKSGPERAPEAPVSFQPVSNGEVPPAPRLPVDAVAESMYRRIVDEKSRRLGMSRRAFMDSASGMAAALFVMNQVYGCSRTGDGQNTRPDGFSPDGGFGVDGRVSAADAAQAAEDARQNVPADALEDQAQADALLSGNEFIFDVQVHNVVPAPPWTDRTCGGAQANDPNLCPTAWIREIFVRSDTQVACLSGFPSGSRTADRPAVEARNSIREIVDRLSGSPRLAIHANVTPSNGAAELDWMDRTAGAMKVAAWKTYPTDGLLDSGVGGAFLERARKTGVKMVAAHRGIGGAVTWDDSYSPRDVVAAAAANPDLTFLVYHAGWDSRFRETAPFNEAEAAPRGVDRLIKAVRDRKLGMTGNVYAELGSTWYGLMREPAMAAHVLGKLLKYLGEDRILWGTDCVLNGNPQAQIAAFRTFQIPEAMQQMYGYPALTAQAKRKILGLNAARIYGVDVAAVRKAITDDELAKVKLAAREDPRTLPDDPRPRGPRTWREYVAFRRWSGETV